MQTFPEEKTGPCQILKELLFLIGSFGCRKQPAAGDSSPLSSFSSRALRRLRPQGFKQFHFKEIIIFYLANNYYVPSTIRVLSMHLLTTPGSQCHSYPCFTDEKQLREVRCLVQGHIAAGQWCTQEAEPATRAVCRDARGREASPEAAGPLPLPSGHQGPGLGFPQGPAHIQVLPD